MGNWKIENRVVSITSIHNVYDRKGAICEQLSVQFC